MRDDDSDLDHGTLGRTWLADEIAKAEARDVEALRATDDEPERVSPVRAVAMWLLASIVLWGAIIGAALAIF